MQNELAHVGRLSAMGQMSAAIAHELNQPLTAIANYAKAAQRLLQNENPEPRQLQSAREAMEKAVTPDPARRHHYPLSARFRGEARKPQKPRGHE